MRFAATRRPLFDRSNNHHSNHHQSTLEDPMKSWQMRRSLAARVAGVAAVVMIVCAFGVRPANAQGVMDQVPAEALVVVKVAKLQDTSTKMAKLMHELGVDAF